MNNVKERREESNKYFLKIFGKLNLKLVCGKLV